ncbi:hypothetical protein OEV98_09115 [Caldibacillus lycopersici]|uniref:Uncharacterized protein n=1 Tax=Perspicuibacillus lycopersici TaxID=1325689 RepID=A0AAE3LML5_9BACI|nr:hypothetical protein [Perspicuibacillus lycopersici]MCU9613720.1 hypothetical protein [Perspicuibacillus lycopersici]
MEGFLFFWIAWSGWIISTFILDKQNKYRLKIAATLLIVIILSDIHISIVSFHISLAAIFLLVVGYLYFIKKTFWFLLYTTIRIITITLAGASFLLMALYDPVWVIFDLAWLQSILFTILALVLFKKYEERIFSTIIGLIQADIIYSYLLKPFDIQYPIGSFAYFDGIALTCLFITTWYGLEHLQAIFQKNTQLEREKPL